MLVFVGVVVFVVVVAFIIDGDDDHDGNVAACVAIPVEAATK